VIAVGLGVFLEDYESKNPCPPQCAVEHIHIDYDTEQRKDYKRNSKKDKK